MDLLYILDSPPPATPSSQASTQSWDSQNGPRPITPSPAPPAPSPAAVRKYQPATTRDQRIVINTALLFGIPRADIIQTLDVTADQIQYAKAHRPTPQKQACGTKPKLRTPDRQHIETWLLASPSHRHIPWRKVPRVMNLNRVGEEAITTAFKLLGYARRKSVKKGFSDDPIVCQKRLEFTEEAIHWTKERLYRQMFTDEV
jgi:hypothetical protein